MSQSKTNTPKYITTLVLTMTSAISISAAAAIILTPFIGAIMTAIAIVALHTTIGKIVENNNAASEIEDNRNNIELRVFKTR